MIVIELKPEREVCKGILSAYVAEPLRTSRSCFPPPYGANMTTAVRGWLQSGIPTGYGGRVAIDNVGVLWNTDSQVYSFPVSELTGDDVKR